MTGALEEFLRRRELRGRRDSAIMNCLRQLGRFDAIAENHGVELKTVNPIWCEIGQPLVNKNYVDFSWLQDKRYMKSLKEFGEKYGKQLVQGWHD